MKVSISLVSLALLAPFALAADSHLSADSVLKRRHLGQGKRQYGGSAGGGYAMPAAPAAPAADTSGSLSSSMAVMGSASMMTDSAAMATSAMSYNTVNWAPSATAAASGWGGNVGGGAYDSCVQQCMATNTMASAAAASGSASAPPAASASGSAAAPGGGAYNGSPVPTNGSDLIAGPGQVVVAPKKGDLRMVPFNIAAKPGDTIEFIWGAGPHTVTQSSSASICNATKEAGAFKSGMQNATFKFPVKVKDENTTFYYCGVAMHCQMGMFGLINGQVSLDGNSSFGNYMKTWVKKSQANQQMWDETVQITINFTEAASWGDNLSTDQFPEWALPMAMESTLMTRQYFAQNAVALAAANSTSSASSASSPASTGGAVISSPASTDGAAGSAPASPFASASAASLGSTSGASGTGVVRSSFVALGLGALLVGLAQAL